MPIYPYSFQLPPLNVQDIPNDGAPGEFLGINVGGALDWLPAGGGGSGDMLAANNLSELTNFATARTNIGLGTASTPAFANLTLTSPSLSSSAPVTISQTWNAGSNVMTALKVVATDTASGATSNLLELWAGSTPVLDFAVTKTGVMQAYGTYSSAGASYARLALACDSSGNATISTQALGTGTAGVLAFSPGNSEKMRITAEGNVGIGTTTPFTSGAAAKYLTISHAGIAGIYWQNTSAVADTRNWNFLTNGINFEFQSVNDGISSSTVALKFNRNSGFTTINSVEIPSSRLIVGGTGNTTIAGNVGIGTTAPSEKLHVDGNGLFGQKTSIPAAAPLNVSFGGTYGTNTPGSKGNLKWDLYTDNIATNRFGIGMSANLMEFQAGTSAGFGFYPNAGTISALHIISSGNVGIGTTAPTAPLHVQGTAIAGRENLFKASVSDDAISAFHIFNGTSATGKFVPSFSGSNFDSTLFASMSFVGQTDATNDTGSNPLVLFQARRTDSTSDPNNGNLSSITTRPLFSWRNLTTDCMLLAANGNLGIGTTSPTSKLHVAGSSPGLTVENNIATGYSEVLFKNTVSTGSSIFLNGSTQAGYGGASSLNIYSSSGPLAFHTASVTNAISLAQNGTCTHAGNLIFAADYSYDIGASGANRPRTIYVGTSVNISGSTFASNGISFVDWGASFGYSSGSSYNHNSSNKALKLTFGGSELLQFGGTSASFPAFKRSTTYLQARLSDDSAFAPIQGKLTTDTAFTATTVTPTGFITLYDSTGTAYKVPCVPA